MNYLTPTFALIVLMGAFYILIGKQRTSREGAALLLAIVAAFLIVRGGWLLFREYGRWQQRRIVPGVVTGRLSSTGEDGTRTIGDRWWIWRRSMGRFHLFPCATNCGPTFGSGNR